MEDLVIILFALFLAVAAALVALFAAATDLVVLERSIHSGTGNS